MFIVNLGLGCSRVRVGRVGIVGDSRGRGYRDLVVVVGGFFFCGV